MSSENITFNDTISNNTIIFEDGLEPLDIVEPAYDDYLFIIHIGFELFKFLVCVCTFVSDIYLFVIMAKFKTLRNRINNFILIYIILNLLYLVLGNFIVIISTLIISPIYLNFCFMSNVDNLTMTLSFYTLAFLAIDWYVLNYRPELYKRFPRTFKYGIGIAFAALAVPIWITNSVLCFDHDFWRTYLVRFNLEGFSFAFCGIILIYIGITKRHKKPVTDTHKTEYAFAICSTVFLFALPAFVIRLVTLVVEDSHISQSVSRCLFILDCMAEILFLAQPLVVLYLLGKTNKYFKMAYLKCCKKNVQDYDDDDLDTGSIHETADNNVMFDKNSEIIRF